MDVSRFDASKLGLMTVPTPATDLTPHWRRIRRDHGDAHAALRRVAEAAYEQGAELVRLDDGDADMSAALEANLLRIDGDGVAFRDAEVKREYLARHAASSALEAWDDPEAFVDEIDEVQRRAARLEARREVGALVLLVLAREHGKDVVGRVGEAARLGSDDDGRNDALWALYDPFCEALPDLQVEAGILADTLEAVLEVTANDLAGGAAYGAVERLAGKSREHADALYDALGSRPDSPVVALLTSVLLGLAASDLPEAHSRALDLTGADRPPLRTAGILALGAFNYGGVGHSRLLRLTRERLEDLKAPQDPEIDEALARAYGKLLRRTPEATGALVELATRSDPVVQFRVASVLFLEAREASEEAWFRSALLNLARAPASHKGIWDQLDHCAARCAEDAPDLVAEFMESAVIAREYGTRDSEAELPKLLDGAFSGLVERHPEVLAATVTRWFASADNRLHRAARDVVHNTHDVLSSEPPWLKLDERVLGSLEERAVADVVRRIMGLVVSSRPLAALLLSAVRRESCSPDFLGFVAGALGGYVLYNFPGEAGDYLRGRIESGDASDTERAVAQAALDFNEAYLKALDRLPRLKEFQPPSQRTYLLRLAQHKQQAAMMDTAEEHSVLLGLFSKLPLKYGRAFIMEREGEFTDPSELNTMSYSAELPRGELIDPIGQAVLRMGWQSAGLPEEVTAQDGADEDADA